MARQKLRGGPRASVVDLTKLPPKMPVVKCPPPNLHLECTLFRFPFEIRDKILHLTLDWEGATPPMLAALRPVPALYQQALQIFRKNNIFEACGLERSCSMPLFVIQAIERLSLVASREFFHPLTFELCHYQPGPHHWIAAINWTVNLHELRLVVDFNFTKFLHHVSAHCPFADGLLFPKLNKLVFHHQIPGVVAGVERMAIARETTEMFVSRMNDTLGVSGKLESVLEANAIESLPETAALKSDVWFWKAPVGKTFARMAWERGKLPKLGLKSLGWRRQSL